MNALSSTPLNARTLKTSERDGIVTEEVRFHSERDGEKDVDIFAYFSYPRNASHLPAFIWNPGGLGQANPQYTETPARRGYAVLCIDFPQPGYRSTGDYPINRGLELGADPHAAPIYHGAVALLKAVSYLQSRSEVDPERIGMAGASWGGFFTTLMIGIDPRLKAGSCLYGTGSLQLGNAWWDGVAGNGAGPTAEQRERWAVTLDPAYRLSARATPIGWFTTTNDAFYSMPAIMRTLSLCRGPTHLTLLPNWDHAMPAPFTNEHVYDWLDVHLRGRPRFATVSAVRVHNQSGRPVAKWTFDGEAQSANLIVSFGESGNWRGRFWHTVPAQIDGKSCSVALPEGALPSYVSGTIVTPQGLVVSTPLIQVDPRELAVASAVPCPDYNGCSAWGGFEDDHLHFLAIHQRGGQVRWQPQRSSDATSGKFSAILESDRTILPPILSVANVPHEFSCQSKAEAPTNVTIQIGDETKQFSIANEWVRVSLQMTPTNSVMGGFPASIVIPKDAKVLIDDLQFHPIRSRP